jgi:multidrug transporter EmrE-like cation transporter
MIDFIDWIPFGYGLLMASMDVLTLGLIKSVKMGWYRPLKAMILPTIVYALQPWLFLSSLSHSTLIVMNLLWDLISNILVTILGLVYFKETVSFTKKLGILLSLISIFILSLKD